MKKVTAGTGVKPTVKPNVKAAASSNAKAGAKDTAKTVANPRLVEAIRSSDALKEQYKSSLVRLAEIYQNENCTRAEMVSSLIEARSCSKATAESQFSRMVKLLKNPDIFEQLKSGAIDLKVARQATKKKQAAPNKDKQRAAVEKRFATSLGKMLEAAKEGGYDLASILSSVRAAAKDEGIK